MTPSERYDYGGVYEGDDDDDDMDGVGDWDFYGDNDEPALCPKCEGETTYVERQEGVQCWNDINNPDEQGITIIVTHHYCADCDHRWSIQHGRPLHVECDCD
jgi:hypothetical protein